MKTNYYFKLLSLLSLLFLFLVFLGLNQYNAPKIEIKESVNEIEEAVFKPDLEGKLLASKISIESYAEALDYYDVKFKKEVLAQAILETGYFKSYNCRVRNNTLGLFNSRKMQYFEFDHWSESIKGYKDMIEYKLKEDEDYYNFLKRIGYAEDPDYISKVKRIVSSIKEDENGVMFI